MAKRNSGANPTDSGRALPKCRSGIAGLDEVTGGGLPAGRPTLICGAAGSGKTLLAMEFLVRGATEFNEPGVFVTFDEKPDDLTQNVRSLGFDVASLVAQKKFAFEYIYIERSEIEETGEYDLEGLFIRLAAAMESVGARRVAIDSIESLFAGLSQEHILRSELRRLFRWLKDKGMTTIVTGERGENTLTRHGIEEYISDCVISLDLRLDNQIATRRLRVVKYRGTAHETNEYPFLIEDDGISVLPITSLRLDYGVSDQRVSTGVPALDAMLGGQGYYRGSSILISGGAGTGKTTLAAAFAEATCRRGEKCLYLAFEESPDQIVRNMRSVGIDLARWIKKGLLHCVAVRPTLYGLEMHLATISRAILRHDPSVLVIDPITNFLHVGSKRDVGNMLMRTIGFAKMRRVTSVFTSLVAAGREADDSEVGVSSLMDTWLRVRDLETNGERNRGLYVLKSRGMAHSNQVREFVLSNRGLDLIDVYAGGGEVLTGAARVAQEAKDRAEATLRRQDVERLERELEQKRRETALQIETLKSSLAAREAELQRRIEEAHLRQNALDNDHRRLSVMRGGDGEAAAPANRRRDK